MLKVRFQHECLYLGVQMERLVSEGWSRWGWSVSELGSYVSVSHALMWVSPPDVIGKMPHDWSLVVSSSVSFALPYDPSSHCITSLLWLPATIVFSAQALGF